MNVLGKEPSFMHWEPTLVHQLAVVVLQSILTLCCFNLSIFAVVHGSMVSWALTLNWTGSADLNRACSCV